MTLEQDDLLYNRYRILDILGRGGMGSVYHAVDESLGVEVAVKENLFVTEEYEKQFRLEAVILASLRHPNLPRVTDHFTIEGQGQYLVMDYIEGRDLRHLMESGPLSEDETIRIGVAVCDALNYLHTRKPPVLHRDIKPGNVRIAPDGQVYLVDFGLAKMSNMDEHTLSGARAMTPGYSPPEQYGTSRTDSRTDVYSLGATLYAALTGFIPEDGLARVVDEVELTPLRKRNPKVSKELADVIERAMAPHATNRYQSADEFKRALQGVEKGEPVAVSPTSPPAEATNPPTGARPSPVVEKTPTQHPPKKRKSSAFSSIMFLILLAAVGFGGYWAMNNPESASASFQSLLSLITSPTPTLTVTPTLTPPPPDTPVPTDVSTAIETGTATQTPIEPTSTATPLVTDTPVPQPPTAIGGGTGKIAFATFRDGTPQIYMIDADGSNEKILTNELNGACQPDWSPDGKKLVYVSPCSGKNDQYPKSSLFLFDIETGKASQLLPSASSGDFEPAWSPDGTKIAFASFREGYLGIFVLNLADKVVTRLTDLSSAVQSRQPAWSPDGNQIVYTVRRFSLFQIWTMSADGENQMQLFRNGGSFSDYLPAWSPDGAYLLFSESNTTITSPSSLMRFDIGGQNLPDMLDVPLPVVDVDFSPSGEWIAYETSDTKNQDIFIYNLLTKERLRLTTDEGVDFDPAWQP